MSWPPLPLLGTLWRLGHPDEHDQELANAAFIARVAEEKIRAGKPVTLKLLSGMITTEDNLNHLEQFGFTLNQFAKR